MDFLYNMGKRYPHAWYARRFFNRVDVSEDPGPHFGMGLDCYVQWSSPIRRITDLQVSIFSLTLDELLVCVQAILDVNLTDALRKKITGTRSDKTIFEEETCK